MKQMLTIDGNEAAARVAHALSEVISIYPITPASPMGELSDAWSARGQENIWGVVPEVIEMQSEAGAAGTVHGALQAGALTTTFTASQGLLLMLPNMYKIAGELTPTVIHVASRTIATHALSIFGDHSDVMGARQTGFAMLASASVQEAQDLALVAHSSTLRTRVPFLHFFDGFRTSHEIAKIVALADTDLRTMIDDDLIAQHRLRSLNPAGPTLHGTAQNPDVFFQAREAANSFYAAVPQTVQADMDRLAALTGRSYRLFDYEGHPEAERVIVVMGSGAGAVRETVRHLVAAGEKVGVIIVRLYRPFASEAFISALPATTRSISVLDRTKEPGAPGEPLYMDVLTALAESRKPMPTLLGGRYGLSSKEFTPPMVMSVFENLELDQPKNHFTVGIIDDVTHTSLSYDADSWSEDIDTMSAVFYGLGADGTVGANKNSVKIVGDNTDLFAQGYFVYDSKKSGSQTVSHLRFSPRPIDSTYLISKAKFVASHQFNFVNTIDLLAIAAPGATFLLNSPYDAAGVWTHIPGNLQRQIIDKKLEFWVVDAASVASDAGLGGRVNTVLQTCFFALSNLLATEKATEALKESVQTAYGKRGEVIVRRNCDAIDNALTKLQRVDVPAQPSNSESNGLVIPDTAPEFVQRVTAIMLRGEGDLLPVSALPVDGIFPTGSSRFEKRSIAIEIPIWDPDICIDCARCALVCPHAAIRMNIFEPDALIGAPDSFMSKEAGGKDFPGHRLTIQVAPDDCTGCGVCVDICPAKSKEVVKHRAINMEPKSDHLETERANFEFFLQIPQKAKTDVKTDTLKGSQMMAPLFEFSGACSGCGETPYVKLMTQMFGDRLIVANATGCSSIYGGNLPTIPYTINADGRGPAWANSLFEDNAEFGLGMRLALNAKRADARLAVESMAIELGDLATQLLEADQSDEAGVAAQRSRVAKLREHLATMDSAQARRLDSAADALIETSIWIVGGDGWAYDIGFGGLDHVMSTGRNVNILVLDTEVYSNTGGQASKATPRAAVAKFASGGKTTGKKDLAQIAMSYGNVYVAQIAMGANMSQTVRAFAEAEAHPGVSLIIAYSPCIAHGIDMSTMMSHQKEATDSGYWPLFRYDPAREAGGDPGLRLDSRKPTISFADFARKEARFAMLGITNPDHAGELMAQAQQDIDDRWHFYEQMVTIHRTAEYAEVTDDQ